jgi:hypothetical protein
MELLEKTIYKMTPLNTIGIILLTQIISYLTLEKFNLSASKYLVLGLIITNYIFVLPSYFIPDNPTNEPRCGMPIFAINLAFWIFGCGSAIITHLTFFLINKTLNKKRKNST